MSDQVEQTEEEIANAAAEAEFAAELAAEEKAAKAQAAADLKAAKVAEREAAKVAKVAKAAERAAAKLAKAAAKEAAKVAAVAAVARLSQNGITMPKEGTICGAVWAHLDNISREKQAPATIAEGVDAATTHGIDLGTMRTQYGRWRKFYGIAPQGRAPKEAEPVADVADAVEPETADAE